MKMSISRLRIDGQISSTAIRNDIYGHFDWLPSIVKPYFVKKVLLI